MRVIIPGGSGLIGTALAQDLAGDGHEVMILTRRPNPINSPMPGIEIREWDGRSASGWGTLADGADAVVNLAGENLSAGRWTAERKRSIIDSRVNAGKAVVQAVAQAKFKPQVLIQISGIGAYGISETETFDEASPYGKDFLAGVTQAWEDSTKPVEEMGVRRVVARSGVVLTPTGGALPRMLLPFRLFVGGPLGSGKQWMSWIHLQDQVRALRFLIESPRAQGVYNLSAIPITNREFAITAGKLLRRPAIFPVPTFAIRLLFGEMATVVLEGQRASSQRIENLGFSFRYPDIASALSNLLLKPAY